MIRERKRSAMKPSRKVAAVFASVAAVLAASIAFTYWMGLIAVQSARKVAHQVTVIQHLGELLSTLKDAETGQRGFIITEQDAYLEPYRQALTRFEAEIETLKKLATTADIAQPRAEAIRELSLQKLAELEQTIRLVQQGRRDAAVELVRSGRGKAVMDRLRSEIAQAEAAERIELETDQAQANRATAIRTVTFASVGLLNLVFLQWAFRTIGREIQLRQQAAMDSARQKEMLAVTLASIGDGVMVTDKEGRITFLNPEAERLSGWSLEQARGQSLSAVFRIVNESTRKPVENPVEKVLRVGRVVGLANHTVLIARDGRETPIDDSAAPIRDAQGTLFGVVLVFRDFSEHKEQERFDQALNAMNLEIHASREAQRVLQQGVSAAAQALGCENAALSLRRNGSWEVSHVHGFDPKIIGTRMNDDEERHAVLAISSRQPVAIDDAFSDGRVNRDHMKKWGIRSVLTVPLVLKGEALGVMFFNYSKRPVSFTAAHIEFATNLATSLSLALENSRLINELQEEVQERRAAEAALKEQKEAEQARRAELEALMETVPAAVWIAHDREAKQITGNSPSYDLLRLPRGANASKTADELEQPRTFEVYRDGEILREDLPIQKAARTGQPVLGAEFELRFTDGTSKWLVGNAVPLRDSQGHIRGSVGAFLDITERRRFEEALRESEQLYRLLFESANDGIVLHEFSAEPGRGRVLQANGVICRMLGYTPGELSRLTPLSIERGEDLAGVPKEASRMLETGHALFEKNLVGRNGQSLPTEINSTLFEFGGKRMVLSIVRDIRPRKQAEAALRESQNRLAETLASINDGFVAFDTSWRYTFVNPQGALILHKRPEEMLGRTYKEVFPEAAGSVFEQQFYRAVSENRTVRFEAYFAPFETWYECNCYPSSRGLLVYFRNVNDRKKVETEAAAAKEELARLNASLEASVQERTAKLQETVADLEQFSYSLAHDLRAPLRSMCSFATFLLEDCKETLAPESLDYLKRIASAAARMDELIRDVLTYSQVLRTETSLATVDLDRLVREIISEYPHLRPDQAEIEVQGALQPVKGNLALVTQCVSNLLGNAVKFVKEGVKPRLRVWTEEARGKVRFCVEDNGIGIQSDEIDRIWRIFERSHTSKNYAGTGIGLSIVKRAAQKMGGNVGVRSAVDVGSTFWFELDKA